jgi:hypothetical protein
VRRPAREAVGTGQGRLKLRVEVRRQRGVYAFAPCCRFALPAALDPAVGLEIGVRLPILAAAFPHLEEGADGIAR